MNPYAQRLLANLTRSMPELPEPERARVVRAATRAAPTSLAAMGRLDAVVAYLLGMGSAPRLARPDAGAVAAFVAELAAPDVFTELDRRTLALALDPAVWRWEERGLPWGA
ncbi:MAG: hypothetical protein KC933_30740, partial [Myxococcales bacterium]|nr:hypothetical protein [Myxococcales bacterium]